jgi:hypothetical protein
MKRTNKKRRYFVWLFFVIIVTAYSQQPGQFPEVEKWQVFTDRTLYIAGEAVRFSAF